MINITTAKEKAKSLLRERSLADAAGFGWILTVILTLVSIGYFSSFLGLTASVVSGLGGYLIIPGLRWGTALPIFLVSLGVALASFAILILLHGGMTRASLRIVRRSRKVSTIDLVLAGDRLGHNISITLWIILYIILWCLIGGVASGIGVWLVYHGIALRVAAFMAGLPSSTTGYEIFGWTLIALGVIWNCVITVIKLLEYSFSYHVAEDKRTQTAHICLLESSRLTNGQKWQICVAYLSFIGWNIMTCTIFAAPFTVPYQYLTFANLYEQLCGKFEPAREREMEWQRNGNNTIDREADPQSKSTPAAIKSSGRILVISGEFAGKEFPLSGNEELRIGRDAKRSNIVLGESQRSVSGLHCGIRFNSIENAYFVTDYSSNGTFVNDSRLLFETPQRVERGATLKLAADGFMIRLL